MSLSFELMTRKPVMIDSDRTGFEAAVLMHHYGVDSVLVVNREKKPIGILTEKDMVRFAATEKILPSSMKVSGIMSSNLVMIDINSTFDKAGKQMIERNVSSLLVTKEEKVVGIITERDIMAGLLDESRDVPVHS